MYLRRPASSISAAAVIGMTVAGIMPSRSSFICTSFYPRLSRLLDELDEHAVGALGIDESDQGPASARPWGGVEKPKSSRLRILQRGRHIVHLQPQVMQAFATRGEENAEVGIVVERFDELDARRPRPKEGDPYAWEPLFATKRKAERLLEMQSRIVYRAHGPAEM